MPDTVKRGEPGRIGEVMRLLPHRYPMLLIDVITELVPLKFATGYKNLTANEPFFQGHFPGQPVMPGVLMIEALAQLGGTLILGGNDSLRRLPFLTGIDKAKFRRPVIPGDRLDLTVTTMRLRSATGWIRGEAAVEGKIACSCEIMFTVAAMTAFAAASVLSE